MLNKKLMISIILFVMLLVVSAVSANENVTCGGSSASEVNKEYIDISRYDDVNYSNVFEGIDNLNDSSNNTYDDLNYDYLYPDLETAISNTSVGGTLYLTKDYPFLSSIYNTITVDGQGHVVGAITKSRESFVYGSNVTLKNIVFKDIQGYNSGAISWYGEYGNLINCTFENNIANHGGAIFWYGDYGNVINCTFNNNKATGGRGGAIYSRGLSQISNSIFNNNFAADMGGAIVGYVNNIYNSTFVNNFASKQGSVITNVGSIFNSKFINNSAGTYGGAIYEAENIINSSFVNNGVNGLGGAIYEAENIINSSFVNNRANESGGAIYSGFVTNCIFINNIAGTYGGAVDNIRKVINSSFVNNSAGTYGGALCGYSSDLINTIFINNFANNGTEIKWNYNIGKITNCTFNGDEYNYNRYFYISDKLTPNFTIDLHDIQFNQSLNISTIFNSGSDGYVMVSIFNTRLNETLYSYFNNLDGLILNLSIPNLVSGKYIMNFTYSGDNVYKSSSIIKYFEVIGLNSNIKFNITDIEWGTPIILNPNLPINATGKIDIYINNRYYDNFTVGSFYCLNNLSGPLCIIELKYLGDDIFKPSSCMQTININRLNTTLIMPDVIDSGIQSIFNLSVNDDATGNIVIFIGDSYYFANINNGTCNIIIPNLKPGLYNISIKYDGDGKYNPFVFEKNINVILKNLHIPLQIDNIIFGNPLVVKTDIDDDVSGTFAIYIDNEFLKNVTVQKIFNLNVNYLKCGKHILKIIYHGDDYYKICENITTFRIFKKEPIESKDMAIQYQTNSYFKATFYDELGSYLCNKFVIFGVNGTEYMCKTDSEGIAYLDVNLTKGCYEILIRSPLVNENRINNLIIYESIESNDIVTKNNTVKFAASLFDENARPLFNTGIIFVIDEKYEFVNTDINGIASLNINFEVGKHTIIVINTIMNQNRTYYVIILPNNTIEPEIVIPPLDEPSDDGSVTITLPNDATGKITFTINDKDYNYLVENGAATIILPNLGDGNYPYTITYSGDNKYSSFNSSGSLKVNNTAVKPVENTTDTNNTDNTTEGNASDTKPTPEIVIPPLDEPSAEGFVAINLPNDATGTVTLTVDGKDYTFDVKNGVADVKLPELGDGNYNYTITYSGDSKYSSFSTKGNMKVNNTKPEDIKSTPEIIVPPLDEPSSDGSVTIILPSDATGKVTLSINGKSYNYHVENGVANVIIPNLGEGDYPYTITYSGDTKYSSFTTNGSLNKSAPKVDPKITAKNTAVQYSAKGKYSVTVYGTDGKVASGVQVIFKISGKQVGKAKTNTKGVASYVVTKNPGKYKIQATALGKSVTKTLTVKHIVTLKTVTLKKSAKKLTLQATLAKVNGKYLKKKTVTFKINGKKVATAKTNSKGVAKITIKNPSVVKKLKVGKKVTYQATYLKDTVKKTAKIKK